MLSRHLSGSKNRLGVYNTTGTNKEKSYKTSSIQLKFCYPLHGWLHVLWLSDTYFNLEEEIYPRACSNGSGQAKTGPNTLVNNPHVRSLSESLWGVCVTTLAFSNASSSFLRPRHILKWTLSSVGPWITDRRRLRARLRGPQEYVSPLTSQWSLPV